jgi:hypothetical protein
MNVCDYLFGGSLECIAVVVGWVKQSRIGSIRTTVPSLTGERSKSSSDVNGSRAGGPGRADERLAVAP